MDFFKKKITDITASLCTMFFFFGGLKINLAINHVGFGLKSPTPPCVHRVCREGAEQKGRKRTVVVPCVSHYAILQKYSCWAAGSLICWYYSEFRVAVVVILFSWLLLRNLEPDLLNRPLKKLLVELGSHARLFWVAILKGQLPAPGLNSTGVRSKSSVQDFLDRCACGSGDVRCGCY